MPNPIGQNIAQKRLAAGELVLCMGVNQMRTPNIALIPAACGSDGGCTLSAGRADVKRLREVRL